MRFFTIETIKINNPAIKTNAAIGIVKNINQGRAAQPQFPSFESGPQKITERKAPAINGKMASKMARELIIIQMVINTKEKLKENNILYIYLKSLQENLEILLQKCMFHCFKLASKIDEHFLML